MNPINKILIFLLVAVSLSAQDKSLSPYFFLPNSGTTESFPLLHTVAEVNIAGVIADIKVTQVYKNEGSQPIEAIYMFPSSTNAAVYDMQMTIGKRVIKAKIKEKEQARKLYDKAKAEGKTASLLKQERPNIFRMDVANILPGDTIMVELFYTEWLIPSDGVYEFVYPTVVGPRFSKSPPKGVLAANFKQEKEGIPYNQQEVLPKHSFDLSIKIDAGMLVHKATCLSHQIDFHPGLGNALSLELNSTEVHYANKDVIIQYQLKGEKIQDGLLLFEGEKENFFMLMIQPPKRPKIEQIPLRDYIFLVDVSGSMSGFPLEVSKKLMNSLLQELQPGDIFNILAFSGSSGLYAEESIPANKENITSAVNSISKLKGQGGTRMLEAVQRALEIEKKPGYARSFVILTDGYIDFETIVFDYINAHLGEANFFPMGIGRSTNRYLIEGIAYAGMGEPFNIVKQEQAEKIIKQFKKYIQTPVLTDIEVQFSDLETYDITPSSIPDLMADRPILVFGKYKGKANGTARLTGQNANGTFSKEMDLSKIAASDDYKAIKYLWARHRLKFLSDFAYLEREETEEVKTQIIQLGLGYNLLTKHTSFIAVDKISRNEGGLPTTVKQPISLPEGVTNKAVGNNGIPPPPPVWEEIPAEELIEEEEPEFVDMSISDKVNHSHSQMESARIVNAIRLHHHLRLQVLKLKKYSAP